MLPVIATLLVCSCSAPSVPPPAPSAMAPAPARSAETAARAARSEVEDFETATVGSVPPGWGLAGTGKDVRVAAAKGDAGVVLELEATSDIRGTVRRPLILDRYRGKRVLVSARARCEQCGMRSHALVGLDIDTPRAAAADYADHPRSERIMDSTWHPVQAIADVAADATAVRLIAAVRGPARAQLDDIKLTVVGDAGAGDEPSHPLDGRARDNVVAFARLYGIVRYFHPSDQAAALDEDAWSRFVARGVRAIEPAADAAALAHGLRQLFAPIAPAVAIYREGEAPPAPADVERPALHWRHYGLGISKGSIYNSARYASDPLFNATVVTDIDPARVRGKHIEVHLRARAKLRGESADVGLWIEETLSDGKQGFYSEPEKQPAVGATWTEIPVAADIHADAKSLVLGIQVIADADAWLETPVVTIDGKPLATARWGTPGAGVAEPWRDTSRFHEVAVDDKGCEPRRSCLHVTSRPWVEQDRRPWAGVLGGGVAATVPLELTVRDGKTVPTPVATLPPADPRPLVPSDRSTRLADVIIAWNIFEHFYPYFDVRGTDWMPVLPRSLGAAATDGGGAALHATLRRLVHELHDGHGSITHPSEDTSWTVPWLWERVEGKVAITQVFETCACDLAPGDVVLAMKGEPIEQAFAGAASRSSAATEQDLSAQILRRWRQGPEGSRRTLTVERAGVPHDVAVALVEPGAAPETKRPASGDEVAPGIRYVDLDSLTGEQWSTILPVLARAKAIVFDVRGYPSHIDLTTPLAHFTRTPIRSARWNIPMPARPDRVAMPFATTDWWVHPAEPFLGNVVFLTDGSAISAAETFMGIVEAYRLGPIVGGPTAGTNGNINPFILPDGYLLWWTGMKVLKQDGSRHHGVGILPTIPAARTLAGVAAGRDEVLEKGIAVAQQRARARARPGGTTRRQ